MGSIIFLTSFLLREDKYNNEYNSFEKYIFSRPIICHVNLHL